MEINSLLYFSCLLVLPIGTNTVRITIRATFLKGTNLEGRGEYTQGIDKRRDIYKVKISRIIEPPSLSLRDLAEILKTPLIVVIKPDYENSFNAKLKGCAEYADARDVVEVQCEHIPTTNLAVTPAVSSSAVDNNRFASSNNMDGGGLLVLTKFELYRFPLESVPIRDLHGDFKLSLSSADCSIYNTVVDRGIIGEFWDSGTDCRNILGYNLTQIKIKAGSSFTVIKDDEIHLLIHLKNGNIILVDAFKRNSKEIWVFNGCVRSQITKGETVPKIIGNNVDSYVHPVGLSQDIERPTHCRELLTILTWQ